MSANSGQQTADSQSPVTVARVQEMARQYLNRSGMAAVDLARRIGYSHPTVSLFLGGRYGTITPDQGKVAAAVLSFIEANALDEDDELVGPLYETGAVKAMRQAFARLLKRPQMMLIYAPPGFGKSTISKRLIKEHNEAEHNDSERGEAGGRREYLFRVYCRKRITPRGIMRQAAQACGIDWNGSIERIVQNFRFEFRRARVAIYFDEAQHLSIDCIDTLRELLDEQPHISLCFAGADDLQRVFNEWMGQIERLERRVLDKPRLPPLTADEAAGILKSELAPLVLDQVAIRQQIQLATVPVLVDKRKQQYISIGRLMANARAIREAQADEAPATEIQ
jgi:DNA transposition AAA+ family ATPase